MARAVIVIAGFNVADAAIFVLKLTLNEQVGVSGSRQIKFIIAGSLGIERDLKVLVASPTGRYIIGVESHRASHFR